jgi:photolyase PhrII
LDVALHLADRLQLPLLVYQGLSERYRFASDRHHTFILEAARELQQQYRERGIAYVFHLDRRGARAPRLAQLVASSSVLVTDDFPLEATKEWTDRFAERNRSSIVLVDTACVVPMRLVGKAYERAFAYRDATANLYRSRIDREWPITSIVAQREQELPFLSLSLAGVSLAELVSECDIDHSIGPVSDTRGGSRQGYARWQSFRDKGLRSYANRRNNIEMDGVSRMSAYLHYGMVSPFRIAREASQDKADKFLDELLVWRELAYAYCYYRSQIETVDRLPAWALSTLKKHEVDPRILMSWETLARAKSGVRLWDAAQRSLLKHGELRNNVRMTWGKAILEWSTDATQTLERLIDLNHRFALDGRDPASYGGILWCLGQFDRPFLPEQPIFGTVRTRPIAVHEERVTMSAYEKKVDRPTYRPSPRIAMIGTGLAGLMCSRILMDHGLSVQLFDKATRSGGRTATRKPDDSLQFDHGAQYFTIRDLHLKRYLESWIADGHVAEWRGNITSIDCPGTLRELPPVPRYVGTPLMESLARHLAKDLSIQFATQVETSVPQEHSNQLVSSDGRELGEFDVVLWNCPPMQVAKQIPLNCSWQSNLERVEMTPCWAVMLALARPWDLPTDGAFVNEGHLSWIARDSSKPGRRSRFETWVLHSSTEFAKANLETQPEQVVSLLVSELERVTGRSIPQTTFSRAHRWLYARPLESLEDSSLWDEQRRMGACGDWCGGPRVEGALKSGMALAGRVLGSLHDRTAAPMFEPALKQGTLFDDAT